MFKFFSPQFRNFHKELECVYLAIFYCLVIQTLQLCTQIRELRTTKNYNIGLRHRYRKTKNRLLKVCNVPATRAGLPRLLFYAAVSSTNEANKAGGTRH